MPTDPRRHAPATLRNREPIHDVLLATLPATGLVLELASGTGEHVVYFAGRLESLRWQPTDIDESALASIEARRQGASLPNVEAARRLDVAAAEWPVSSADAVVCINMIHIAPWTCCSGLMRGAGRVLPVGGPLIVYGPFRRDGRHTATTNAAFDDALRAQNPEWGVRDLDDVEAVANTFGLLLDAVVEMPANNLCAVFRKR